METNVVGLPQEWKNILCDACKNVAVFDFYGASASTNKSTIHFFHMQNLGCMLRYKDHANWNFSSG